LANVQATLDAVDPAMLDAVVDLLVDAGRDVLVLAGEAERGIAAQFVYEFGALRPGVQLLGGSDVVVRREIALSRPGATVVAIDLRRYERWLLEALEPVRRAGHTIVALSDGLLSPLAMTAKHSFAISAASVSPFDSHVGTLALLDLLVATSAERLRVSAAERLEQVERAWADGNSLSAP
jgi:DNA-binding MurR/RpiR family transcriptional regulator